MTTLGLIGVGRWGTNILNTLRGMRGIDVVTARDPQELLTRDDIRGILIATPGSTHADIALPFIKKGIPTFIEKPMTTSLPDAKRLAQAANTSKTPVFVGHIHLYNPAYLKAKELVQQTGGIRYIMAEGMNNGPYRDDMSALWDWAPHDVVMAIDMIGEKPTSVQAWGMKTLRPKTALHDTVHIKLEFPKNVTVFITNSWLAAEKRKKLTIIGKNDTVVYDDTSPKKVIWYQGMGPAIKGKKVERQEPKASYPRYGKKLSLTAELEAFIHMIRTGKQPLTDVNQGLEVVRVIAAAEKSIHLDGKRVSL